MNRFHLLTATLLLALQFGCHDADSMAAANPAAITESANPVAASADQSEPGSMTSAVAPSVSTPPAELEGTSLAAASDGAAPNSWQAYQQSLQRRCETDADCVVKNVGNCCGYYPQCVHREVQPSPATIKAICESEQRQSICGFEEPTGCQCVSNKCQAGASAL